MKNIKYRDVMADAKKSQLFKKFSQEAKIKMMIADEVYKRRKELKIDQKKLAELAETTQRIISNIESGQINIGVSLLSRIAKALNLPSSFGNTNFGVENYSAGIKWDFSFSNNGAAPSSVVRDSNLTKVYNNF
ncbi:MAG: helix-turn-helix transcriptional regulator [Patescibacteria group bacterium]|jgi:transcriptional regulator with XRE-family HTH domain